VPYDDLFAAVEYSLRHEVPPADGESLSSDKLRALKHWLKALTRGLPTSPDGGQLRASIEVVAQKLEGAFAGREALTAARYNAALDAAEPPWGATSWTHCTSPHPELHGYPCSLWLLFHSLLAHATDDDAFSVVLAIQEYVHAFFSCRECADNFEKEWQSRGVYEPRANAKPMSLRHRWALWLWRAHNSVSERLAATQVRARSSCAAARVPALTTACAPLRRTTRTPSFSRCRSGRRAPIAPRATPSKSFTRAARRRCPW
jgi:thiol oxidase